MKNYFEVRVDKYIKDDKRIVYRPASLNNQKDEAVMFITEGFIQYANALLNCKDCLIFWPKEIDVPVEIYERHAVCLVGNPHNAFARFFRDNQITYLPINENVSVINGAYVGNGASIGTDCRILPGAYISSEVVMGNNVYIGTGVKLMGKVHIGNNVVIRENTVIGADGLTTDRDENGKALTIPQFGGVVLEDDVQIGALTVIGRGAIDDTRICKGSKIDNCTFISHNVYIGENTFVVGETIMFGSSSLGDSSLISGNSTIMNAVNIGNNCIVGAGAVVTKSVVDNTVVLGNPAKPRGEKA